MGVTVVIESFYDRCYDHMKCYILKSYLNYDYVFIYNESCSFRKHPLLSNAPLCLHIQEENWSNFNIAKISILSGITQSINSRSCRSCQYRTLFLKAQCRTFVGTFPLIFLVLSYSCCWYGHSKNTC